MQPVTVDPATGGQCGLIERLVQLYLHDFSEWAPRHSVYGEVDADGLFPYPPGLDSY